MKKSKIAVLVLSLGLLMGGISSVQTANNNLNFDKSVLKLNEETELVYKTVLFGATYNSKAVQNYTSSWTTTNDGLTCSIVNANNNNNGWKYIKMGSKNSASVGKITTATPIDKVVTSVDITIDAVTAGLINSLKLYVSSDSDFATSDSYDITIAAGKQNVVIPDGVKDVNKYYKIEADCQQGTDNGLITISQITFNISKSDFNPADAIEKEETKAQLQYSFDVTQGESVSSFVKVTENLSDWSGQYLIVYEEGKVAFDGSLKTLDAVSNTQAVTISDSKIKATEEMKTISFEIAKSDVNYTIKSASGYYIGHSGTKNALKSSTSSTYLNTITWDEKAKNVTISCNSYYLRYNNASGQTRFRYFASGQNAICLYKLTEVTETNYTFSNMKMNFGSFIHKDKFTTLTSAGSTVTSYGVAIAKHSSLASTETVSSALSSKKTYVKAFDKAYDTETFVYTDETGTLNKGDYVAFSANVIFGDKTAKYVDVYDAVAYVVVDGDYVFLQEKSCSVSSLADEYVASDAFSSFTVYAQESLMALSILND